VPYRAPDAARRILDKILVELLVVAQRDVKRVAFKRVQVADAQQLLAPFGLLFWSEDGLDVLDALARDVVWVLDDARRARQALDVVWRGDCEREV